MTEPSGPERGAHIRIDAWLRERWWFSLSLVVVVGLVIRAVSFPEVADGSLARLHRWDQSDMHFFDRWARLIADGDWLTDRSLHPYFAWPAQVAGDYLRAFPEEVASLGEVRDPAGEPVAPERALWDRWYGGKRFHQEPMYPYLVAMTYGVFGADVRAVFLLQMALGVAGNALVFLIAARAFGHLAGLISGLLAASCGLLVFYESVLIRSTCVTVSGLLLTYVGLVAVDRLTGWRWFFLGVTLGMAILVKSSFSLFAPGLILLLAILVRRRSAPSSRAWRLAACLIGGVAVTLLPPLSRNLAVGAPAFSLSSVGALAFICSNSPDYSPENGFVVSRKHVHRVLRESDGAFLPSAMATLGEHPGLASYATLSWKKWRRLWHWYEIPNNVNYYYYRLRSAALCWLPVTFWIVSPLGIVGCFLALRRVVSLTPLYLLVLTHVTSLLVFYVLARFRAPLLAAFIPFAGLAIVQMVASLTSGRWRRGLAIAGGVALIAWLGSGPIPPGVRLIRTADYSVPLSVYYLPETRKAQAARDWPRVIEVALEALEHEDPLLSRLSTGKAPDRNAIVTLRRFAYFHAALTLAFKGTGRPEESATHNRRAQALLDASRRAAEKRPSETGEP